MSDKKTREEIIKTIEAVKKIKEDLLVDPKIKALTKFYDDMFYDGESKRENTEITRQLKQAILFDDPA